MAVRFEWRGRFGNTEVNVLHAEAFAHRVMAIDWVCARDGERLVGFVNVPWDGGVHAFILDTIVASGARRQGVGKRLVALATEHARAAGCEWLHVDFDGDLAPFYLGACGFRSTPAGLAELRP